MAKFTYEANRTSAQGTTVGSIVADATNPRRGYMYSFVFGSEATPADVGILLYVGKITSAGTSGNVTVVMLDNADVLTQADAGEAHSGEPAYGGNYMSLPVNQRTTVIWTARPGMEFVYPATGSSGIGAKTQTLNGGTPAVTFNGYIDEK